MIKRLLPFLLLWSCVHAQQYSFRHFTPADGISSSVFNHIFQDSRGYLWFSTQGGGIIKFNGKEFTAIKRADGLSSNDVTCAAEDENHTLWVGTTQGATAMLGQQATTYGAQDGLSDGVVYSIFADHQKQLWFATQDDGVKMFDGKQFRKLKGLSEQEIYTVNEDANHRMVFGTAMGIYALQNNKVSLLSAEETYSKRSYFCSSADNNGNVWMGSTSGEVVILRANEKPEQLQLPAICSRDFIGSIAHDKNGNVWLGTDHGLLKYDGHNFKLFGTKEGLSVATVQAVACDAENNIWVGTLNGGLYLLRNEAFVSYGIHEGLSAKQITALAPLNVADYLLVGTDNGLFIKRENQVTKISLPSVANANISSIARDAQNNIWLSAQDAIYQIAIPDKGYQLKKTFTSLTGIDLVSPQKIICSKEGKIWLATYGSGLFCLANGIANCFNTENNFASDKILTVFEDSHGIIWIGTQDAGAFQFDGKKFSPVPLPEKVADKSVWSIDEDANGNIYLGTGESGIAVCKNGMVTNITTTAGLTSDFVPALVWDNYNSCLWAAGEKGLNQITVKQNGKPEIQTFTHSDGFGTGAVNQNCLLADGAGFLYLGTSDGLWRYDRRQHINTGSSASIQLTGLHLFYGKEKLGPYIKATEPSTGLPMNLVLPYNKNHLTFDIRALTMNRVSYSVKLEGQDDDWSSPTENDEITYSNIEPGKTYTFKAKAINPDGLRSKNTISFTFSIQNPWWKTWWFYLLSAILLLSLIVTVVKLREKNLREQNIRLEETVRLRTKVIENQKQTVEKMLTEKEVLLKEIHHRVKNNLQTISSLLMLQGEVLKDEQAQKAIAESQNRVRSIALVHQKLYQTEGLEKVELDGFIHDLTDQVKYLFPALKNELHFCIEGPSVNLLIDKAIPLGLILNELLTNSLKYAFQSVERPAITIHWQWLKDESVKSKKLKLSYTDNGSGFDFAQKLAANNSLGVELVSLLSEQIGADINYTNTRGSEFVFIFGINI